MQTLPGTLQISVSTDPDLVDDLSDQLMEMGALAISLTDAQDEPLFQLTPEEEPLWQLTTLNALFPEDTVVDSLINTIKHSDERFKQLNFTSEVIAEKNWVAETQKQFPAQKFGSLWVYPEWEKDSAQKTPSIFIAPGLAFGTGTHPTTKLCLEWLSSNPPKSAMVIDYGCGSGILSLAAQAMGAAEVFATDHDPQALQATIHNASCNHFSNSSLHAIKTNEMQNLQADILLANILANPLIDLEPTLIALTKPGGTIVLSGLLNEDIDRVSAHYQKSCTLIDTKTHDGWALLEFKKHSEH